MGKFASVIQSIGFKLFIANTLVPIVLVFTLGSIAYNYSIELLTRNEYDRVNMLAKRTDNQLNQYLFDMRIAMVNLSTDLAASDLSRDTVRNLVNQYEYRVHPFWQNVYYISRTGDMFVPQKEPQTWNGTAERIYNDTLDSEFDLYATNPYFAEDRGVLISLSMPVRKGTHIEGVLVSDVDLKQLNDTIQRINFDQNISMLTLSKDLTPILSDIQIKYTLFSGLWPALRERLASTADANQTVASGGSRYLVIRNDIDFNQWSLIYFVDENHFLAKIRTLKRNALLFSAIFAVGMILYSYNVTRYINKPIQKLMKQMGKIKEEGHLKTRIKLKRKDEFLTLANSFNDMLDRIEYLLEEKTKIEALKKQFELKALQSQINPHFLFNTLNSINSLVDLQQVDKIPGVIDSLVRLFSYTLDKQQEWSSVQQELQGLQHYIELQQIRRLNKFSVVHDYDPAILSCGVLKLTLQPIVENAIFHGISGKRGHGNIHIGGYFQDNGRSLLLFVEDDGCGIRQGKLKDLLDPEFSSPVRKKLRGFNSIGLKNVHERIRLHFGKSYGVHIISEEGHGTRVEIAFPAIPFEQKEEA